MQTYCTVPYDFSGNNVTLNLYVYTGWLIKKHPQLCNDVLLNNRIQTNVMRFCFDSEIGKRVLGIRNVQNNQ